jgi:hypothetical protein
VGKSKGNCPAKGSENDLMCLRDRTRWATFGQNFKAAIIARIRITKAMVDDTLREIRLNVLRERDIAEKCLGHASQHKTVSDIRTSHGFRKDRATGKLIPSNLEGRGTGNTVQCPSLPGETSTAGFVACCINLYQAKGINPATGIKKARLLVRAAVRLNLSRSAMKPPDWHFECDTAVFERIKSEESFQQILALARAVNGLQFVISALVNDAQDSSPRARRSRINSFLFGSAILYEGLLLVEKMNQQFGGNETFDQGLHTVLRDRAPEHCVNLTWAGHVTLLCFTTIPRSSDEL